MSLYECMCANVCAKCNKEDEPNKTERTVTSVYTGQNWRCTAARSPECSPRLREPVWLLQWMEAQNGSPTDFSLECKKNVKAKRPLGEPCSASTCRQQPIVSWSQCAVVACLCQKSTPMIVGTSCALMQFCWERDHSLIYCVSYYPVLFSRTYQKMGFLMLNWFRKIGQKQFQNHSKLRCHNYPKLVTQSFETGATIIQNWNQNYSKWVPQLSKTGTKSIQNWYQIETDRF